MELLDGLPPWVVETGDIEQATGHDEVEGEVGDESDAEEAVDERLAPVVPQPSGRCSPSCVEDWEGVEDEPELLVGEERVEGDEGEAGEEEDEGPPV